MPVSQQDDDIKPPLVKKEEPEEVEPKQEPMETEEKKPEIKTEPKEEEESGANNSANSSTTQNRKKSKNVEPASYGSWMIGLVFSEYISLPIPL